MKRQYRSSGDFDALQKLYELVDDRDALAALARERMGQAPKIETTR